jgi:hypothetical protein
VAQAISQLQPDQEVSVGDSEVDLVTVAVDFEEASVVVIVEASVEVVGVLDIKEVVGLGAVEAMVVVHLQSGLQLVLVGGVVSVVGMADLQRTVV